MTVLADDLAQFINDVQASNAYLAWARDNHGGKGYSIDNPKTGSELQKWMVFRDQLLRGTRPVPPAMVTAFGRAIVDAGVLYLDATLEQDPPPPTSPAPAGKLWGISPSNNGGFSPSIDTQMAEYVKLGINCPRIPETAADSARAHGFKQWIMWVSGDGSASIDTIVSLARKYPEAAVGFGNEINLAGWTPENMAAKQIQLYQAVRGAGLPNKVMLSSLAQSPSNVGAIQNLAWCKRLAAAGCVVGRGFDWADFHCYPYPSGPAKFEQWQHIYTPDSNGDSCVSVLGGAPFFISEMGAHISNEVPDQAAQAAAATAIVKFWAAAPGCLGGAWFQAFDGTGWAGFGLIDGAGNHRPSYDAFKAAVAA